MEVKPAGVSKIRQPRRPKEYYMLLYCKRKKKFNQTTINEARRSWSSLTADEKEIFINKFSKWQESNHQRLGSILQYAEPFMKKKKTTNVYAASIIDTDLDETTSHQEINAVQSEPLTEPIPPTVKTAEELFETLKYSGARPDLAEVAWKQVKDKDLYRRAVTKMNKEYLIELEQYLESLPDPELFNYYIKTLHK